jgi:hypothetical protein
MKQKFTIMMMFIVFFGFAQNLEQNVYFQPDQKVEIDALQLKNYNEAGWFIPAWDLFDNFYGGDYSLVSHYANLIFPDSIVRYESSNGSILYNWICAVGQVLDPYSPLFFEPLEQFQSYRIDSMFVLGWYRMVDATVVDTLIAEFVIGDPLTAPHFAHSIFTFPPDTLRTSPPRMLGDTTQMGYFAKLTAPDKIIVKYPLTTADSTLSSGKYITLPVGIEVPYGKVIGVSISFVPGYSYGYNDVMYSYNSGSPALTQTINSLRVGLYSVDNTTKFRTPDPSQTKITEK